MDSHTQVSSSSAEPPSNNYFAESKQQMSLALSQNYVALFHKLMDLDESRAVRPGLTGRINSPSPLLHADRQTTFGSVIMQILWGMNKDTLRDLINGSFMFEDREDGSAHGLPIWKSLTGSLIDNINQAETSEDGIIPLIYVLTHNNNGKRLKKMQYDRIIAGVRLYMSGDLTKRSTYSRAVDRSVEDWQSVDGPRRYIQSRQSREAVLGWCVGMEGRMRNLGRDDPVPFVLYVGFSGTPYARWEQHWSTKGTGLKELVSAITSHELEASEDDEDYGFSFYPLYECTTPLHAEIGEHNLSVLCHSYVYEDGFNVVIGGKSVNQAQQMPVWVYQELLDEATEGPYLVPHRDETTAILKGRPQSTLGARLPDQTVPVEGGGSRVEPERPSEPVVEEEESGTSVANLVGEPEDTVENEESEEEWLQRMAPEIQFALEVQAWLAEWDRLVPAFEEQ